MTTESQEPSSAMPNQVEIPLINVGRQTLLAALDGQEVRLTVWYQPNDYSWYASLEYPPGTKLVSGRRLTLNGGLLSGIQSSFNGNITCRSIVDTLDEPDFSAWGRTHALIYSSES